MYKNYSTSLFSLNKAEPDFLPFRFRLPSGETRYNYYVSLSELNLCGYLGPFEKHLCSEDEKCVWDPSLMEYKVEPKTEEDKEKELDALVRARLEDLFTAHSTIDFSVLSLEAYKAYKDYFSTIESNLAKDTFLTLNDIPSLDLPVVLFESEAQAIYASIVTPEKLDYWKTDFIDWGNEGWQSNIIVANRFTIPPDWVRPI